MKYLKRLTWLLLAVGLVFGTIQNARAVTDPGTTVNQVFIVTAPTSPNNNICIQNTMVAVMSDGKTGYLPTDGLTDPTAVYKPLCLRVCEFIYTPVGVKMRDGVANPTGNMANENGGRLAWGHHYSNSVPFLVTERYYVISSSDGANTIRFPASGVGNLATNGTTGALLTFSPTLRGRVYDAEGHMTEYNNGESVLDHPVNEVFALIRVGYLAPDMNVVVLDMNYFLGQMQPAVTNYAGFWGGNSVPSTNWISSLPAMVAYGNNANGDKLVVLHGQRRLGMTYGIQAKISMTRGEGSWTNVVTGILDGGWCTNTILPGYFQAYYRGVEEGVHLPAGRSSLPAFVPVLVGNNGPEE